MEQKTALKKLTASTKIVGIVWIAFALFAYFCEEKGETIFIVFPHIMFFVIFLLSAIFHLKNLRYSDEKERLEGEYQRKENWEEFQYNLYKEERLEKQKYDAIRTLIEKLDDKKIEEHPFKKEIEKFRVEIEEWKKSKDKQFFIEVTNNTKSKKS
jgi:hypothetical protein